MKAFKKKLFFEKITPTIQVIRLQNQGIKNRIFQNNKKIKNGYLFGFNLRGPIDFSINSKTSCSLPMFDAFIYHGKIHSLATKLKDHKQHHLILFCIEAKTLSTLIEKYASHKNSQVLLKRECLHSVHMNLKIIDELHKICDLKKRTSSEMELISRIYMLLHLTIKQLIYQEANKTQKKYSLKKWEIIKIEALSKAIQKDPGESYTVRGISRKTGVCIAHLQRGFKEMHGMTIALYIREMRLLHAESLIRKSDYNISEIVYNLGLSSRSYFSKIFKQKYNCTPSEYKSRCLV